MTDAWLTKQQLAERFGLINQKTGKARTWSINTKCATGEWPSHKVGGELRFSPEDIKAIEELLLHPARQARKAAAPKPRAPRPQPPREGATTGSMVDLTPIPISDCRQRRRTA